MTLFVDADSCPRAARRLVIRAAERTQTKAVFAANRPIPDVPDGALFCMAVCPQSQDAADDYITRMARAGDLAVTRDVPLAERLVQKSVAVLDDRGRLFNADNIRALLSIRNFTVSLAENGVQNIRHSNYGNKELKAFADAFDKQLARLKGE